MPRLVRCSCLSFFVLSPLALYAGQIYGFIVQADGSPLKGAAISISCGGPPITGATAADGTYRINVPQQGSCKFALPNNGGASAEVVSYPNPSQYNFQLVNNQLQRR